MLPLKQYYILTNGQATGGHYATSWKVAGSIPDEVIVFFN
jgi:hypothetical protein